jgi:membrane protease YdiL (CAAX protease family)
MFKNDYKEMHDYYSERHGLYAIFVYIISIIIFFMAGLMWQLADMRLFVPAGAVSTLVVFAAVLICKNEIASIGITKKYLWQSALLGIVTGAVFFFAIRFLLDASLFERAYGGAAVARFMHRDRFAFVAETPFWEWFPSVLAFIIATVIHQELFFRGYLQTRLRGIFKSDILTTVVTGFLFILFYMPLHTILSGQSFSWVFLSSVPLTMVWMFALHCWLNLLHRVFNNIAAPILFHIFFSFHSSAALTHSFFMGF